MNFTKKVLFVLMTSLFSSGAFAEIVIYELPAGDRFDRCEIYEVRGKDHTSSCQYLCSLGELKSIDFVGTNSFGSYKLAVSLAEDKYDSDESPSFSDSEKYLARRELSAYKEHLVEIGVCPKAEAALRYSRKLNRKN